MTMKCSEVKYQLVDYIEKQLNEEISLAIKDHVSECTDCAREAEEMAVLIRDMNAVKDEVPDPSLRAGFLQMLEAEKKEVRKEQTAPIRILSRENNFFSFARVAAALMILVAGAAFGWIFRGSGADSGEIAALRNEMEQMKMIMMVSQLSDGSASQRMQVAQTVSAMPEPSEEMLNALVITLNNDENVNVRLAAVAALSRYTEREDIRSELIRSLNKQDDPFLQITLINLMIQMQDRNAIPALERTRNNNEAYEIVRQRADEGLGTLM
jgi:hypothetical protein